MRRSGAVAGAVGLGRHDHLCWSYDDEERFRAAVVDFLADGVRAGQRVAYAAEGDDDGLLGVLAGLDGWEELLRSRTLVLLPLGAAYRVLEPGAQVASYREQTRAALRDGFRGLRVAAEATPLVVEAPRRRVFVRYEQLIDRYMVREPFAAMCAYNTGLLAPAAVTELACVHPVFHAVDAPPFRLYAAGATEAVLAGEVDSFCHELFAQVVADMPGEVRTLDLAELDFIDHHGLLALDRRARAYGGLELRGASDLVIRLCKLLRLEHLRPVT